MQHDAALLKDVGSRVRVARKAARVTQSELAERTGMARASIANLEAGRQDMSISRLASLAAALGVPVAALTDHPGRLLGGGTVSDWLACEADEAERRAQDEEDGLAEPSPGDRSRVPAGPDAGQVYSIRIPVGRLEQVRVAAVAQRTKPSVLMRDWVTERLDGIMPAPHVTSLPVLRALLEALPDDRNWPDGDRTLWLSAFIAAIDWYYGSAA